MQRREISSTDIQDEGNLHVELGCSPIVCDSEDNEALTTQNAGKYMLYKLVFVLNFLLVNIASIVHIYFAKQLFSSRIPLGTVYITLWLALLRNTI